MFSFSARSVSDALERGIRWLQVAGVKETSRNGDVLVAPGPVCSEYTSPMQRTLFSATRDANPFFHVVESAWMLAGRNDLALLRQYNSRFGEFSDDGVVLSGAYGYRWRRHFGFDQLPMIVDELTRNPDSRRAVLTMWDPRADLARLVDGAKDVCCNTQAYFDLRNKRLNMTVVNRSNDAIWGAYGANAVHFSYLQEYLAMCLKMPVGVYRQFSNNLHAYTDIFSPEKLEAMADECDDTTKGERRPAERLMWDDKEALDADLMEFGFGSGVQEHLPNPASRWFKGLVNPVMEAWEVRKAGASVAEQLAIVSHTQDADWRIACTEWINRRIK